ncbi:MAG: ComEC/Rec2 family competence protein [Candidatus Pacebacteria bacterium]|nr:ComEC/Rec2 family competence protein [Candidatus Paceibacterota bacterium]
MTKSDKFLLASVSFVLGILIASFWEVELWILFLVSAGCVAGIFVSNIRSSVVFLCIFFLSLGVMRYSLCVMDYSTDNLSDFTDKNINFSGRVVEVPEVKNGTLRVVVEVEDEDFSDGLVLAFMSPYSEYFYGDEVNFEGKLKVPESFDDFDYRKYLLSKNIYFISYYPNLERKESAAGILGEIYKMREKADSNVGKLLPQPEAGILSAMTLGVKSGISDDTLGKFNKTGVRHIIAVSGMHMVILVSIIVTALLYFGINRRKIFYLAAFFIAFFVVFSGSPPSAVRAGVMSFVLLLALKVGRPNDSINALLLAAVGMLFFNPRLLLSDVGFQMSFLAALGIIKIFPYLRKKFAQFGEFAGAKDIFLITLSAQIAILPIMAENFGEFSFFSFPVNLLIIPVVPFVMAGGFLLIGASFINIALAQILALPILIIMKYQLAVIDFFSRFDFGIIKF